MSDWDSHDVKNLRTALQNEELPALRDAGLLSPSAIDYLETYRETYEHHQGVHHKTSEPAYWYHNSKQYVNIVRKEVSKALSKAVDDGNLPVIQHALGLVNGGSVEMDFKDFFELEELLNTPALMLNIFASPRTGKTFTGARICDLWLLFNPSGLVISNIESWAELHPKAVYEKRMPNTIKRAEEHDGPVLKFMDELSADGTHADIQKSGVEAGLRSYFRKMGKEPYKASYIGVGHRVVEVAPMLRSGEVAYFGFKEGKTKEAARKHLVVYEDEDKENKVIDLKGIGLPEYSPDTDDPAEWDWGTPEEFVELGHMKPEAVDGDAEEGQDNSVDKDKLKLREREDMCLRMNEAMSHSEINEATGIPKSTIGDMIRRAKSRRESTD